MNNIKLLLVLIFSAGLTAVFSLPPESVATERESCNIQSFTNLTKGKIIFDLYIPVLKEKESINIINTGNSVSKTVFSVSLMTGNVLYPTELTPDKLHHFEIEFDLSCNFCKVFIDGQWLTSVLALKQFYFVNGICVAGASNSENKLRLTGLQTEGSFFEFPEPLKIVAFGNSTTAYRRTITAVYSQRLPEFFQKRNIPVHVFNEGIGGSHTGRITDNSRFSIPHALDRFDTAVLARNPDFVTINFGINDSWVDTGDPDDPSRIPLEDYRKNLLYMVNRLKMNNISVIMMTPNVLGKNRDVWRKERTEKYVKVVRKIAGKERLTLIDQWKIMPRMAAKEGKEVDVFLLPDGMHPNDSWHQIQAEIISGKIFDLLKNRKRHHSAVITEPAQ